MQVRLSPVQDRLVITVARWLDLESGVLDVEMAGQAVPEIIEDASIAAGAGQRSVVNDDVD